MRGLEHDPEQPAPHLIGGSVSASSAPLSLARLRLERYSSVTLLCGPQRPFMGEDCEHNVRSGKPLLPVARPAAALCGLGQRECSTHASGSWRSRSLSQLGPDRPIATAAFSCAGA